MDARGRARKCFHRAVPCRAFFVQRDISWSLESRYLSDLKSDDAHGSRARDGPSPYSTVSSTANDRSARMKIFRLERTRTASSRVQSRVRARARDDRVFFSRESNDAEGCSRVSRRTSRSSVLIDRMRHFGMRVSKFPMPFLRNYRRSSTTDRVPSRNLFREERSRCASNLARRIRLRIRRDPSITRLFIVIIRSIDSRHDCREASF